jgi:pyruvate formate lyase activating enzyme
MGRINSVFTGSALDGPGVRTVVFFQGCPLRCVYCHNPETQSVTGGEEIDENALFEKISRYSVYYGEKGGVTFSGGDPLMQPEFLSNMLELCKKNGIHTAVDTAGLVPFKSFEQILPYTDLFLYDVKCYDSDKHKKYTGASNELIFSNLRKLLKTNKTVWVRIPIIPTVNDTEEEMLAIKSFLYSCRAPKKIELLPYHSMGEHKYAALGKAAQAFSIPSEEKMMQLKNIFS